MLERDTESQRKPINRVKFSVVGCVTFTFATRKNRCFPLLGKKKIEQQ